MFQVKSLNDDQPGDGQLGLHMALTLANATERVLFGFVASPAEVGLHVATVVFPPPTPYADKSVPRTQS